MADINTIKASIAANPTESGTALRSDLCRCEAIKVHLIHLKGKARLAVSNLRRLAKSIGVPMSRIGSNRGKELSDLLDEAEVLLEGAEHAARLHWPILLIEGIALILFGILAVFIPPLITIGLASSLGWVFVFGGIAALFVYFRLYRTQAFRRGRFCGLVYHL
ncbi:MAG: DUF308 domain-containing protein [Bradyrhizobium sp.]|uniref:DUF308 domain-containing protein n=1 Tax=Bradyrhizobium sp. TaxID=376 RepID=UPI001C29EFCC|nr:DUF308 domain-containing protein [Bradyrhizobium sp.]MBU6461390.1 DUF308 domain-containing protein [Pseudomonadota bacterium]MDE2066568.1 DUF308 domain-containing protein [Bradyrhizobium sp.]MDE2467806.1 DUF308 domain-containing protein [Bradyrhizobium sp.]